MMRATLTPLRGPWRLLRLAALFVTLAGPAAAHPGHLAPLAGHAHGEGLGLILAAALLALIALGRRA